MSWASLEQMGLVMMLVALSSTSPAADPAPVALKEALKAKDRTGYVPLAETYRGELREVARTGSAKELETGKPEVAEFTYLDYQNKGIGNRWKPVLTIMVGNPLGYSFPVTYAQDLPETAAIKKLKTVADFEKVFGDFRGWTDAWGGTNEWHSSLNWSAFTMQPDGSLRVVSAFIFTVIQGKVTSIDGVILSEGVFKPTGKAPHFDFAVPRDTGK